MKRIAFTIIFNGLHHLKHNDYAKFILNNFDYWVVVEGGSKNQGSTGWCKEINTKWHNNGKSVDGTVEYLTELKSKYSNLILTISNGFWNSKDEMVNTAINEIKKLCDECILWEIDIDEQWTLDKIEYAEKFLLDNSYKNIQFLANAYVGKNLLAIGQWGESTLYPYRRLWKWNGENFATHEPPMLQSSDQNYYLCPNIKFDHYSYYFENDVIFKSEWYGGHERVYEQWKKLQELDSSNFPIPISYLLDGFWGSVDAKIIYNDKI